MKIKSNPINRSGHALKVSRGSHISRQSAHNGGKVVSPTHLPPLTPGNILGTHFCQRLSRPQGQIAAGRISDTIGNRTRDLPAYSAAPQITQNTACLPPTMEIYFKHLKVFFGRICISSLTSDRHVNFSQHKLHMLNRNIQTKHDRKFAKQYCYIGNPLTQPKHKNFNIKCNQLEQTEGRLVLCTCLLLK